MLLSYVALANAALGHIGEDDRISDPDEECRAARTVKTHWEPTRLFVLSDVHWDFARRTFELSARPAAPEWPIALGRTAYPLPPDLVSFIEIIDPSFDDESQAGDSYSVEGGPNGLELLVDHVGPITIRYVRDHPTIADPARWSPGFSEAFAFRLAWQISDALAADKGRKDRALGSYNAAIKKARKANARTKAFRRHAETDWSAARRGCRTDRPVPTA